MNQETKEVTESYRDTLSSEKFNKPPKFFREVTKDIAELRLFEAIDWQKELKEANVAKKYRDENTVEISSKDEFYSFFTPKNPKKPEIHGGFAVAYYDGSREVEEMLKENIAEIRNS